MKAYSHYCVILHTPDVEVREIKFLRNVRKLIKKEGDRVKIVDRVTQNQRFHKDERVFRSNPEYPLDNIKANLKSIKRTKRIGNYFLDPVRGWTRTKDLDQLCSEQRAARIWENNLNCRGGWLSSEGS